MLTPAIDEPSCNTPVRRVLVELGQKQNTAKICGKNIVRIFPGGELIVELTYGGTAVVREGVLQRIEAKAIVPFTRGGKLVIATVLGIVTTDIIGIVVAVGLVCIIGIIIVVLKLEIFREFITVDFLLLQR